MTKRVCRACGGELCPTCGGCRNEGECICALTSTDCRLAEVKTERERQDEKWGEQNHPVDTWVTIIAEELGEVARASLKGDGQGYRSELIQVAACAVAAVEAYDRQQPGTVCGQIWEPDSSKCQIGGWRLDVRMIE